LVRDLSDRGLRSKVRGTLDRLIGRLEGRLGTRLLARTTRALRPTEEGEAYHHAALPILQDLNDAELAAASGAVRGRVRINASLVAKGAADAV
jgi:DNA-binding transcriptional LysR family regulator